MIKTQHKPTLLRELDAALLKCVELDNAAAAYLRTIEEKEEEVNRMNGRLDDMIVALYDERTRVNKLRILIDKLTAKGY